LTALPGTAAESLRFSVGTVEFSIPVEGLAAYAEGENLEEYEQLAAYLRLLSPERQERVREILRSRYEYSSAEIEQFLNSPMVAAFLIHIGDILQTESRENGADALQTAIVEAGDRPGGFTLVDIVREFPSPSLYLDIEQAIDGLSKVAVLVEQTRAVVGAIEELAIAQAAAEPVVDFSRLPDLRKKGPNASSKQTFTVSVPFRDRHFEVDLYLPSTLETGTKTHIPTIIISHGLASDRSRFEPLARHLASYGFAVAVPQHPGSDYQQLQDLLAGKASDLFEPQQFRDRPADISRVLDDLEELNNTQFSGRLDLENVGILGHSLGGYTAFAVAGAPINFDQLEADCNLDTLPVNPSLFLQCRALELPRTATEFGDPRVGAILTINPVNSSILGASGLAKIDAPVMVVASSLDLLAPAVLEQVKSFTWLTSRDRYLVLKENDNHFFDVGGFASEELPDLGGFVRPSAEVTHAYIDALSVAFFKTHIADESDYRSYLQSAYAIAISDPAYPLHLVRSLTSAELLNRLR